MTIRRALIPLSIPLLSAALLAALLLGSRPAEAVPDSYDHAVLPTPTGTHPVATRTMHLVDRSRPDPWAASPRDRHLMVTMTYPARADGGPPARYLTPRESRALVDFQVEQGAPIPDDLPRDVVARTVTGASRDLPVLRGAGRRPLVLLSPGFSLQRSSLTSLATDLASRGYVVAQVGHAHEDAGTELPSGRLLRCVACASPPVARDDYQVIPPGRVLDLRFVLDRLLTPASRWHDVVDPRRVAAVGHSIGGNAAVSTLLRDRRVAAAVDLDGTLFEPPSREVTKPVMLMGAPGRQGPTDRTWHDAWPLLRGPRTWVTVAGTGHGSFTDDPLLIEQLGLAEPGEVSGERGTEITRAYVAAFLDRHLRGRESPLLDGPVAAYPEVRLGPDPR